MSKHNDLERLKLISLKIEYILNNCNNIGIVKALEDEITLKPAIMMHLTSISEQFSKVKDKNLLSKFDKSDLKGAIDTRNFIAHDYEGINLAIIEFIIRERLPLIKKIIDKI
jgi:uncharacterized protein with HEPN domain